ncbi:TIGR02117 family protein [Rhizobium rosettiformans]|uniref:TIGR02117 family protein n=1 Tax=Rhizobium rosettiformans W3 TaxID=538378 RepID=A0A4S8Q7M6_9HYPH|nr:TIGR02117 family protein [Rhizobium rosettiformans W3]
MKTLFRRLAFGLSLLIILVALGTLLPRPLNPRAEASLGGETAEILLLANPIHTDIALPVDDEVRAAFADLVPGGLPLDMPGVEYLIIGWGGRSFYIETPTWGDIRPLPVFKALTVDRSVLHVSVAGSIDLEHPSVRKLAITEEGRRRMITEIRGSFVREDGMPIAVPGAAYGLDDAFFEARGAFNALVGCNTWTAAMLRSAGIRTGWWTPMPQLLDLSLHLHHG